jgi:hypothetical protein
MGVQIELTSNDMRLRLANILVDVFDRMRDVFDRVITYALHNRERGELVRVTISTVHYQILQMKVVNDSNYFIKIGSILNNYLSFENRFTN